MKNNQKHIMSNFLVTIISQWNKQNKIKILNKDQKKKKKVCLASVAQCQTWSLKGDACQYLKNTKEDLQTFT